ncbi:MAG: CRTAC1 family protein [Planctomycetota bacterium]
MPATRESIALIISFFAAATSATGGPPEFIEDAAQRGFGAQFRDAPMITGAAAADFDKDGDIDVFVPHHRGVANALYRNNGDGTFVDIASSVGLDSMANCRGGIWFDYDNDRDLDLLVGADQWLLNDNSYLLASHVILYEQQSNGSFVDVTAQAGLLGIYSHTSDLERGHLAAMSAGDLDCNGHTDVVVSWWAGDQFFLMNKGNGTFTAEWRVLNQNREETYWTSILWDFDGDGDLDIHQNIDFRDNRFYENDGNGMFTDIAPALGMNNAFNEMGAVLGDFDADGDFDIFATNIFGDPGEQYEGRHNILYRNNTASGVLSFDEVSASAGVQNGDWGWGCSFFDYDLDSDLDLAQTNGFPRQDGGWHIDESRLFVNNGAPIPVLTDSGLIANDLMGGCLLTFDADRDGDLEILETSTFEPCRFNVNQCKDVIDPNRGWVSVIPRSSGANGFAVGATVRVTHGAAAQIRPILAGQSSLGQEPHEAHFGLGDSVLALQIDVEWMDGSQTTVVNAPRDRAIVVTDRTFASGDVDESGATDVEDLYVASTWFFDTTGDFIANADDIDALKAAARVGETADALGVR